MLRKDLSASGLLAAISPMPRALYDPTREPAAYRELLAPLGIGPCLVESGDDWILIERLEAPELWQIGDTGVWSAVAAWVARMHAALAEEPSRLRRVALVSYDAKFFALCRRRAAVRHRRGLAGEGSAPGRVRWKQGGVANPGEAVASAATWRHLPRSVPV